MNADDIFKRYILKQEDPVTVLHVPIGARQSGRTSRAIMDLSPNSIYVCPNVWVKDSIKRNVEHNLGSWTVCDINFLSLDSYLRAGQFMGKRAANGEMIAFDHTVYEEDTSGWRLSMQEFERLLDVNNRARASGFNVIFDEQLYLKLRPYS
jgi:hypothetical protein